MMSQGKKGNKPEILVVEDSRTEAELLRHSLEENGYDVTTAEDGKEALSLVNKSKPDLIISDICRKWTGLSSALKSKMIPA
jgi:CheY-like chemotaxis protein